MKKLLFIFFSIMLSSPATGDVDSVVITPAHNIEDLNELPVDFKEKVIRKNMPFIRSYWQYTPDIRLCLDSGVSEASLKKALSYWERLGYRFGDVVVERADHSCMSGGRTGEITILLFNNSVDFDFSNHLAVTLVHYHTTKKYIIRSQIYINSYGASKERALEHEIGHALGWTHYNRRYHLMNKNHDAGGHDATGLKRSSYDKQVFDIISSLD